MTPTCWGILGLPYQGKCELEKLIKQNAFNQQFVLFTNYGNCH